MYVLILISCNNTIIIEQKVVVKRRIRIHQNSGGGNDYLQKLLNSIYLAYTIENLKKIEHTLKYAVINRTVE